MTLPPPTNCDNCKSDRMGLTSNSVVNGRESGEWPYCYYCDDCSAVVACHPNTYNPMGYMANAETRNLRSKLHSIFDPIWRENLLSRSAAYEWLGSQLLIVGECHISQFSKEQLEKLIQILVPHFQNDYIKFRKRKQKNDARKSARNYRQFTRIVRRKSND